jgi:hypothetical protein
LKIMDHLQKSWSDHEDSRGLMNINNFEILSTKPACRQAGSKQFQMTKIQNFKRNVLNIKCFNFELVYDFDCRRQARILFTN